MPNGQKPNLDLWTFGHLDIWIFFVRYLGILGIFGFFGVVGGEQLTFLGSESTQLMVDLEKAIVVLETAFCFNLSISCLSRCMSRPEKLSILAGSNSIWNLAPFSAKDLTVVRNSRVCGVRLGETRMPCKVNVYSLVPVRSISIGGMVLAPTPLKITLISPRGREPSFRTEFGLFLSSS